MRFQECDFLKYLFVMAHPDDEADLGGTIWRLSICGHQVAVAIVVGKVSARRNLSETLETEEMDSMQILGVSRVYHADFPNIKTNTVPHADLVQFVLDCIEDWSAEAIVTHHTADVNIDHAETGRASISACRQYFKDGQNESRLKLFLMCETAGATEWSLNSSNNLFEPNYFVEIGKEGLDKKIEALHCYKGVERSFPHPQCVEVYEGLAAFRGAQSGCHYAEAYQCVFMSV